MLVEPIGWVRNAAQENLDFENLISNIEVLPKFSEGLYRIEEFEELIVLFIFDRSSSIHLWLHPHGDPKNPEVGVFASHSPNRPNHIGVTKVRLLGREGNILRVKGLDALDGTPVIDIKPVVQ